MTRIRRFRLEDLTDVIEFSKRAHGYEEDRKHLDDLRSLTECCARGYAEEPEGMFVAEVDGKVVGTMFAFAGLGEPDEGSLHWVGVDPAIQGKGIGKKLLARAEAYLRSKGAKKITLGTDRPKAMPFYVKQGYGVRGCRMMKRLATPKTARRRTRVQKIIEVIEGYAAFRFTHHNVDHITRDIDNVLRSRAGRNRKVEALIKIAEDYVIYPMTAVRAETARKKLKAIL